MQRRNAEKTHPLEKLIVLFGLTSGFCDKSAGCQNNCDTPKPKCTASGLGDRRVGYYQSWATYRKCGAVKPSRLVVTGLTHLNFAFASIDPVTFKIAPADARDVPLYTQVTNLKKRSPKLKVYIAVGGWAFNDPGPTRNTFSKMASTPANRNAFIQSVISFMRTYGFDGVDLDWEYPAADDRGGSPPDTRNYILLVREMKQAFSTATAGWGITIAIPASFWYLQHFDLALMQNYIDWFNLMSYDYVGVWDAKNKWTGPYVGAHTNLTMTQQAVELLWRSNVSGDKINMGLGYYGRSFTLKNKNCAQPGCEFMRGGRPGVCSEASGVLMNMEIQSIQRSRDLKPTFDKVAGVKYLSWDDQWVSFDDAESIAFKKHWAAARCIGGLMVWALDQDTPDNVGLAATVGLTQSSFHALAQETPRPPRTNCYIAFCGDECVAGYSVFGYGAGRFSSTDYLRLPGNCHGKGGRFAQVCCPSNSLTGKPLDECAWFGNDNAENIIGPGPFRKRAAADGPVVPGLCKTGCPAGYTEIVQNTITISRRVTRLDDQWSHGYCLEGYASYCCRNFRIDPNITPPPLFYKESSAQLVKRSESFWELVPIFGWGLMFKHLYEDSPNDRFVPVKIGIEFGGSQISGFPPLPSDEMPWQQRGGTDTQSGGGFDDSSEDEKDDPKDKDWTPPRNKKMHCGYHQSNSVAQGAQIGSYTAVAQRTDSSKIHHTYTCVYERFPQVCENIRSAIEVRGAARVLNYLRNPGQRRIPETWKRQHGQWPARPPRPAGSSVNAWLVYTPRARRTFITNGNGQVRVQTDYVNYPTCEVDEYPFHSSSQNLGPNVIARLVPQQQNRDQGEDWQFFLIANRIAPWDDVTVTWRLPPHKMQPMPWVSQYDLGINTHCFPAQNNDPNRRISDPAFAVLTNDPFVASVSQKLAAGYHNVYPHTNPGNVPIPTNLNFAQLARRGEQPDLPGLPVNTDLARGNNELPSNILESNLAEPEPTQKRIIVPVFEPTGPGVSKPRA
ncbi:hypothetical protein DRE_04206 [Drechslerella stenobrocha 248]|uniref:chitinase n=1 Tax=Drechslerella stenobrocha 248 TaxID=1043628 RepID=W7I2W8_9PEZI|nr:hypothetical protein DRE_04206 [Drechslerella stenobrocha 248]